MHAYKDAHIQRLIDEYPVDGVQAITRFQSQCANVTFSNKYIYIYNILFQKCNTQRKGIKRSTILKIFENSRALEISVVNSYSEDQSIHILLENCHQDGK